MLPWSKASPRFRQQTAGKLVESCREQVFCPGKPTCHRSATLDPSAQPIASSLGAQGVEMFDLFQIKCGSKWTMSECGTRAWHAVVAHPAYSQVKRLVVVFSHGLVNRTLGISSSLLPLVSYINEKNGKHWKALILRPYGPWGQRPRPLSADKGWTSLVADRPNVRFEVLTAAQKKMSEIHEAKS